MKYSDPHQAGSETEQHLRQQVDELKRQLREQKEGNSGTPPKHWRPSAITITALIFGLVVLFAGAFVAGYIPLQRREALVRAESTERGKDLPRMAVMRGSRSAIT